MVVVAQAHCGDMTMTDNLATTTRPDETLPDTTADLPDNLPQHLTINDLPPAIANLDRRSQLILVCLASNMRVCDIAQLCNTDDPTIHNWITRHGLRELVSTVTPQLIQNFRATRWQMVEQAALTHAQRKISDMSASQAIVAAAISADKQAAILPPVQREGDAPGELEAQLTIRFKRKT